MTSRLRILLNAEQRAARPRLFGSLESAYPLQFVATGDADGAIAFDSTLSNRAEGGPALVFGSAGTTQGTVRLGAETELEPLLRGMALRSAVSPAVVLPAGVALATGAHGPAWIRAGQTHFVAAPPAEPDPGEPLLAHLLRTADLGTVALLHFLRGLLREWGFVFPPVRAAFVLDDPNLHRPRYGWADFEVLARSAADCGYHVAIATIPADCWYADSRAVRLFRERQASLSLAVHGFAHLRGELGARVSETAAHRVLAGARRRIDQFAARHMLDVAPVIIPPHGELAQPFIRALPHHGFEAVVNGGFPGNYDPDSPADATGSLGPAHFMRGGVAFIRRDYPFEEQPAYGLLSLTDAPILLGCHHQDLAGGVRTFEEIASAVNACGNVSWLSLKRVCDTNLYSRLSGQTLEVRLVSRAAIINVPMGGAAIEVEVPSSDAAAGEEELVATGPAGPVTPALGSPGLWRIPAVEGSWELRLRRRNAVTERVEARVGVRAALRRAACEIRDRIAPLRPRP
jgi:hypothetical protein